MMTLIRILRELALPRTVSLQNSQLALDPFTEPG
jgi:hypothetical protein